MEAQNTNKPRWIVARLGDDFNWWLDQTSEASQPGGDHRGLLDPRQIVHLLEALDAYRLFGLRRQLVIDAFQMFMIESEIAEDRLRLAPAGENILAGAADLFALPVVEGESEGRYYNFLDALGAARIRRLNATHHYAQACTEDEMYDELDAVDSDRYFSADDLHVFDEINEILQWSPAE